jgi:hypothetical protein
LLHLVYEFALPNNAFEPTGRFLRFGGHPELTVQESSHAKARSKNDVSL